MLLNGVEPFGSAASYTYDAENNLLNVSGATNTSYPYNAFNERVRVTGNGVVQRYGYDQYGRRSTVWNSDYSLDSAQYYAGGSRVAFWSKSDGGLHYEHQDWLGTERVRTNAAGTVEASFQSLPFGDGLSCETSGVAS